MAVIQRPSTYGFIQKACRGVRSARAELSTKIPFNSNAASALRPTTTTTTTSSSSSSTINNYANINAKAKAARSRAVPYNPASKRRVAMALVDMCTAYIEGLWPNQQCRLPLRKFVFEILRRSRVQYPIFQVALCYMARLQPVIRGYAAKNLPLPPRLACGRRTLVASLQIASKFLQDRCYSAKVWARISGLALEDLKSNEIALMEALDWSMFVSYEAYMRSCKLLRVSVDSALVAAVVSPNSMPNSMPNAAQNPTSMSTASVPNSAPNSAPNYGTEPSLAASHSTTHTRTPMGIPTPSASPEPSILHSPNVEIWDQ